MHGDRNENERIDTDTTETQQWKVSECFIYLLKIIKKMKFKLFSHHHLNVFSIWS